MKGSSLGSVDKIRAEVGVPEADVAGGYCNCSYRKSPTHITVDYHRDMYSHYTAPPPLTKPAHNVQSMSWFSTYFYVI